MLIPTNKLKAALTHAGDRDIREYLNGVHFEADTDGQLLIVATDGHRAFIGQTGLECPQDFTHVTIPRASIKSALAGAKAVTLACENGQWRIGSNIFTPLDSRFPDWRRIVPKTPVCANDDDWNMKYLADAESALQLWCGVKHATARLQSRGKGGGATVVVTDPSAFCVIMPKRLGKSEEISEQLPTIQPAR